MSKLVIVESSSKAKTIRKILGDGYDVVASNGHVIDLPKTKMGVDIENDFKTETTYNDCCSLPLKVEKSFPFEIYLQIRTRIHSGY